MLWFVVSIVITGIGVSAWIKQGYDTRPNIEQQQKQNALQAQPAVQMENSPADTETTTK